MVESEVEPNPLHKPGYRLEVNEEFDTGVLNTDIWLPYYLPHWSSRERSATHYRLEDSEFVLKIDEKQKPWCPEVDGEVKRSSLQSGIYAGPLGSPLGQHRGRQ